MCVNHLYDPQIRKFYKTIFKEFENPSVEKKTLSTSRKRLFFPQKDFQIL